MIVQNEEAIEIESPCIRSCCLDGDDICLGCFRHIDEIRAWKNYESSEKQTVINVCQQRRLLTESKRLQGNQ